MRPHAKFFDPEKGRTRSEFARECDINHIMARAQKEGVVAHVNRFQGEYGDFATFDFQEALDKLAEADAMFLQLPSAARKYFDNDPAKFLDYVNSPGVDYGLLQSLGLGNGPVPPPEVPGQAVPEAPASAEASPEPS